MTRAVWDSAARQKVDEASEEGLVAGDDIYEIKRLVSPEDEQLDLSDGQKKTALQATISAWHGDPNPRAKQEPTRAGGLQIRKERSSRCGLLLLYPLQWRPWMPTGLPPIGFAVSFPASDTARKIRYRVTNLWWEQEFGSDPGGSQ